MAQLHKLALKYQRALDAVNGSVSSSAADVVGEELFHAIEATMQPEAASEKDLSVLDPIILRTTLAASIAAYFECILWAAVTPDMLNVSKGTPLAAANHGIWVLTRLYAASTRQSTSKSDTELAVRLVKQVHLTLNQKYACKEHICLHTHV